MTRSAANQNHQEGKKSDEFRDAALNHERSICPGKRGQDFKATLNLYNVGLKIIFKSQISFSNNVFSTWFDVVWIYLLINENTRIVDGSRSYRLNINIFWCNNIYCYAICRLALWIMFAFQPDTSDHMLVETGHLFKKTFYLFLFFYLYFQRKSTARNSYKAIKASRSKNVHRSKQYFGNLNINLNKTNKSNLNMLITQV